MAAPVAVAAGPAPDGVGAFLPRDVRDAGTVPSLAHMGTHDWPRNNAKHRKPESALYLFCHVTPHTYHCTHLQVTIIITITPAYQYKKKLHSLLTTPTSYAYYYYYTMLNTGI